jgi:hypothetical protein
MELLLLLQELQQERARQTLKSPLPFPTTLPLLSSSLVSSRTAIADPIQYLQRMTSDLLNAITGFATPPSVSSSMTQVKGRKCTHEKLTHSHIVNPPCGEFNLQHFTARILLHVLSILDTTKLLLKRSSTSAEVLNNKNNTDCIFCVRW